MKKRLFIPVVFTFVLLFLSSVTNAQKGGRQVGKALKDIFGAAAKGTARTIPRRAGTISGGGMSSVKSLTKTNGTGLTRVVRSNTAKTSASITTSSRLKTVASNKAGNRQIQSQPVKSRKIQTNKQAKQTGSQKTSKYSDKRTAQSARQINRSKSKSLQSLRDGVIYQRVIKDKEARQQVSKQFGKKMTRPYIGKTTTGRLRNRQAEHARNLGIKPKNISLKVIGREVKRETLPVVEQGFIKKRGGIKNLANRRNAVSDKNWKKKLTLLRQEQKRRNRNKRPAIS